MSLRGANEEVYRKVYEEGKIGVKIIVGVTKWIFFKVALIYKSFKGCKYFSRFSKLLSFLILRAFLSFNKNNVES